MDAIWVADQDANDHLKELPAQVKALEGRSLHNGLNQTDCKPTEV